MPVLEQDKLTLAQGMGAIARQYGLYLQTCPNGCRYCYANKDHAKALQNYLTHDPKSPLLLGHLLPTDTVKPLKQESFLSKELSLFD